VNYELSGWFGGAGTQADTATLTARFLNSNATALGSNIVGNVTDADRGGVTGLLLRSTNGTLPSGTRFVEFVLTNRVVTGMNDASADNLSFVLTARPDPTFQITSHGGVNKGWAVEFTSVTNRLYVLERSQTLQQWLEVTRRISGTGQRMTLVDTNPLLPQAFYRVARPPP